MQKKQILLIIGIAILLVGIPLGVFLMSNGSFGFKLGAQTDTLPQGVSVSNVTPNSVTITWSTGKSADGAVSYGLSANQMNITTQENSVGTINHTVNLSGLVPNSHYYFVIVSGGEKHYSNQETKEPYTFDTPQTRAVATPTPTTAAALTELGFQMALGTNNPTYDLNKDGIVNTLDLQLFRQQEGGL